MKVDCRGVTECAMHMMDGMLTGSKNAEGRLVDLNELLEIWGDGCAELYVELGSYAHYCDSLFTAGMTKYGEMPGMFDYEVSCEFGWWFGSYIACNGHAPDEREALNKLDSLAKAFFSCYEQEPSVCESCDGRGAILAFTRGAYSIQRCDSCKVFEDDSSAIRHVFEKFLKSKEA